MDSEHSSSSFRKPYKDESHRKEYRQTKSAQKIIERIQTNLTKNKPVGSQLQLLKKWLAIQVKYERTLEDISHDLNELKIPTISGIGKWRAEDLLYLLHQLGL